MSDDVRSVMSQLTTEEKASLLGGSDVCHTSRVERLGIPAVALHDGPHGVRKQLRSDRLDLGRSIPSTCFPPAAGLASSWDVDLIAEVGAALGDECRALGVSVLLGPGVNMKRSPLGGRNFEYFSEDPHLAGELAAAMVRGVQSRGVGTSVKHFAVNNQETDRMTVSADVDERTLREIYLPAFERVVREHPWTVMCAYNRVNGVPASQHRWLLTDVLRDEWGFDGVVVSDWGAVDSLPDAVAAGLDLEMPSSGGWGPRQVLDALDEGTLAMSAVDRAVARVLRLVERSHRRADDAPPGSAAVDTDAHHRLARRAAAGSIVLLRNEGDLLPLDPSVGGPVAVIGEFARTPRYQGAGSSLVTPTRLDDALTQITEAVAGGREVGFAPGYRRDDGEPDAALVREAADLASRADVVVLFVGLPPSAESEGHDRDHLRLPESHLELLAAVTDVHDDVVVVLSNGGVVEVDPWQVGVRALLETWLLGQAGGGAIADVLVGAAEPSGRLAESIPRRLADNPTVGNFPGESGTVRYGEGLLIGYRWYDTREIEVAYPFGHGLSYTTFEYSDLAVRVTGTGAATLVAVSLDVANTGGRDGVETVQVYVRDVASSVFRPRQELKAFTKVAVPAGGSRRTAVVLTARDLSFWDVGSADWLLEDGEFEIRVGASSRDIRLSATVTVTGDPRPPRLDRASSVQRWLAHPVAGPRLRALLGDDVEDPDQAGILLSNPLGKLARYPGSGVTHADVAELLDAAAGEPVSRG